MIKIDKEFKELIPPLTKEEYTQLEENIVKEGIRDPLVVWRTPNGDDILVDGHNRWKISANHAGIRFEIVRKSFQSRAEAKAWIIKNQLGRRNIPPYVRAELALTLKPEIEKKAKANQGTRTDISQKSVESHDTQKELARAAGVSHDTIHKVEKIQQKAPEETKQALRRGEISINQVYSGIVASEHENRRQQEARELREAKKRTEAFEDKKSEGVVEFEEMKQNREDQELIAENFIEEFDKLVQHIRRFGYKVTDGSFERALRGVDKYEIRAISTHLSECHRTIVKMQRVAEEEVMKK